jgi:hypothetical protein
LAVPTDTTVQANSTASIKKIIGQKQILSIASEVTVV